MAKKKNSMALFEVVASEKKNRSQPNLSVPGWMRKKQDAAPEVPESATPAEDQPDDYVAPETSNQSPVAPAPRPQHDAQAMVSTEDGRLTISLNYVSCTVALLAVVLVLVVIFMIGRASARSGPVDDAVPTAKADMSDVTGGQTAQKPIERPKLLAGKQYLVIQDMGGKTPALKADAEHIIDYLKGRGREAMVVADAGTGNYMVLLLKPFESSAAAQEDYVNLHAMGNRYSSQYGKDYDFRQMNAAGKFAPRFIKAGQVE